MFSEDAFEKLPLAELHVALVAAPETEPVTSTLSPAHTGPTGLILAAAGG